MLACRGNVPRNELLQAIGAEASAFGTREDRIFRLSALLRHPFPQSLDDVRTERRTSHLASLPETADMRSGPKLHILAAK